MKGLQQIPCLRSIKSIHSIGARSIPKVQRSSYLELYVLRREKERLEKEILMLDKRRNASSKFLDSVNARIEKLLEETGRDQRVKSPRNAPARSPKKFVIHY